VKPPPGRVEDVRADSVLVVAPHPDDEVLGCGGLIARLAAGGAAVRVLFLTDGGELAETRRREAKAAAEVLGLTGLEHLGLPDGELGHRLEETARGIERALVAQRPRLLLVPSPLEVSADHRAAFAAVHRLLGALRRGEGGPLRPVAEALTVLVYEVNHPAHPDVLVDVSDRIATLEAAMAAYPSQQGQHDYLAASLGLRRFRTLTLSAEAEVAAAEGYRRLTLEDFVTRSPDGLVAHLGGAGAAFAPAPDSDPEADGPWVSVVVRTRDRPALLAEALASLAAGRHRNVEVVLVNDGGEPPEVPEGYPFEVQRIDHADSRGRAAAAQAGVEAAGGDWVAFLDDDDLASPEHLSTLTGAAVAGGARVVYSDACVALYELTGDGWECAERRLPYSRDFDPDLLLLDNYIPFNTLLIERRLFGEVGAFDDELPFFEDWDYLIRLAHVTPFHHLRRVTCEYRHFRGAGHHVFGERPRERGDFLAMKARVIAKHRGDWTPERLARAVDLLRSDAVDAREEADAKKRALAGRESELARLAAAHRELADRFHELEAGYHRQHGELTGMRDDLETHRRALEEAEEEGRKLHDETRRLDEENRRLYGEEAALREAVAGQDDHLQRTYAEIERLGGLIRQMEGTRAWRLHQMLQRKG
jgi:LmbE family N-acetylglucosaminyl deacetylase